MASIWDYGDMLYDTFTGGTSSSKKAQKVIDEATTAANNQLAADLETAKSNLKSSKELYQLGKETASAQAGNKAGIAKKNAKAAAMQNNRSRLMSAIQGAEAANTASQEGFDAGASNAMSIEAQNQQNKYNADVAAAQQKAQNTMTAAQSKANLYNNQASNSSSRRNAFLQIGASFIPGGNKK